MSETRTDPLIHLPLETRVSVESAHALDAVVEKVLDDSGRELPQASSAREESVAVRSLTNSPGCEPRRETVMRRSPGRRQRTVRVDAWAEPASVSWSRTRTTVRKVSRASRSTDWALPF